MADLESKRTKETREIENLLLKHFPDHPAKYPPMAYRYNRGSIRVRVVSKRFAGKDRSERWDMVAPILKENLPEDTWLDIMLIVLVTPDELKDSPANWTFEHPTPAPL
jgi:stress-induced morphogen